MVTCDDEAGVVVGIVRRDSDALEFLLLDVLAALKRKLEIC